MTVQELLNILITMPENAKVIVTHQGHLGWVSWVNLSTDKSIVVVGLK